MANKRTGGDLRITPITSTSINRAQAGGSAVGGYGKPKPSMKDAARGRVAPEAGTGMNGVMKPNSVLQGGGKRDC